MTGRVFVAQGDLTKLVCDEVLIPTDRWLDVGAHWAPLEPLRDRTALPSAWRTGALRVTDRLPHVEGLPHRRMVNSGATEGDGVNWLLGTVDQALDAATAGLAADGPSPRRGKRLLALPVLGTGAGGYDARRGEVLDGLLERCAARAADRGVDVAIVCYRRSDFTAVQARRSQLPGGRSGLARRLGRAARDGQLALFLGAGVSVGAGLPDWRTLLEDVAASDARTASLSASWTEDQDLWTAASQLQDVLGEAGLGEAVDRQLSHTSFALAHALLASLPGREAVTTNFDRLFESARSARTAPALQVLPYARGSGAYLLKLHGDARLRDVVLQREALLAYDEQRRPLAGLLQGLLLTRHLLFVGCSMQDDNVLRNVDEVAQLVRKYAYEERVGTILTLTPQPALADAWDPKGFSVHAAAEAGASEPDAGRALEVLLDEVLLEATFDEGGHLLDPAYAALLDGAGRSASAALRDVAAALPPGREWEGLRRALRAHGAPADPPD